jgi:hypothetical protein
MYVPFVLFLFFSIPMCLEARRQESPAVIGTKMLAVLQDFSLLIGAPKHQEVQICCLKGRLFSFPQGCRYQTSNTFQTEGENGFRKAV